ncbi:hypothetical protein RvY_18318 [Ramazzottius varieornatus]|uniref:BED-type domain-containing protein n=1 Tax=Ramazzottius varieornatus TaxID=947166 RepID=A0A1D1W5T7_RAMVA|nr:hypothetical protein RvY_18318 [Ramazzottius varieornatus]
MFRNRLTRDQELEQIRAESEERDGTRRERDDGEIADTDVLMDTVPAASPSPSLSSPTSTVRSKKSAKDVKHRAPVYKYWKHDERAKKFKCGFGNCRQTYADSNSSSVLSTHTRVVIEPTGKAEGKAANSTSSQSAAVPKAFQPVVPKMSRKVQQALDDRLKRLITGGNLPFALVDYPEFIESARALNPLYEVPSRNTLKAWLVADFGKYKQKASFTA